MSLSFKNNWEYLVIGIVVSVLIIFMSSCTTQKHIVKSEKQTEINTGSTTVTNEQTETRTTGTTKKTESIDTTVHIKGHKTTAGESLNQFLSGDSIYSEDDDLIITGHYDSISKKVTITGTVKDKNLNIKGTKVTDGVQQTNQVQTVNTVKKDTSIVKTHETASDKTVKRNNTGWIIAGIIILIVIGIVIFIIKKYFLK